MTTRKGDRSNDVIKTYARSLKDEPRINRALIQELERLLAPEQPKSRAKKAANKAA